MERNQFWIFIGLAMVIGVCLQILKGPSTSHVRIAGFSKFEKLMDEGRPVYDPNEAEREAAERPVAATEKAAPVEIAMNAPVARAEEAPAEGDQAASPADAAKKPEKPKTPEEKKKEEEAKKKKEAEKKKKEKEKKKKDEAAAAAAAAANAQNNAAIADEDDKKEPAKQDDDALGANNGAPGMFNPFIGGPAPDGMPKTIAEWENYLLTQPDFERISKFIKLFQGGTVKPDVFYPVIEAALADSRPKIRELAIMALGATPSQESFTLLADELHNDHSAQLRSQADSYLKFYARIDNLRYVTTVISGTDVHSQYEAIRVLKLSAEENLKAPKATQLNQQGSSNRSAALAATMVRLYQPFVAELQTVETHTTENSVRSVASETLAELQNLLAGAGAGLSTPLAQTTQTGR